MELPANCDISQQECDGGALMAIKKRRYLFIKWCLVCFMIKILPFGFTLNSVQVGQTVA
jgi:hypothetical protein